jgi:hypothetical protein
LTAIVSLLTHPYPEVIKIMGKREINKQSLTENQVTRLIQSVNDFSVANSALIFLSEVESDKTYSKADLRRFRCFETTAIISYARPFSESRGSVPRLTLKLLGIKLEQEKSIFHNHLITLRNKIFAHSDSDMMRFISKPHRLEFDNGFDYTFLETVFDEGLNFSDLFERIQFDELISTMLYAVIRRLHDEAQIDSRKFDVRKDSLHSQ